MISTQKPTFTICTAEIKPSNYRVAQTETYLPFLEHLRQEHPRWQIAVGSEERNRTLALRKAWQAVGRIICQRHGMIFDIPAEWLAEMGDVEPYQNH